MLLRKSLDFFILIGTLVFFGSTDSVNAASQQLESHNNYLSSSKIRIAFDHQTHEPAEIRNLELSVSLSLIPISPFRLELDKLHGVGVPPDLSNQPAQIVLDARDCDLVSTARNTTDAGSILRNIYSSPHGQINVEYRLGTNDHFFQIQIRFIPSFTEPYLLRRVSCQNFRFADRPKNLVSFRHGRCMTHFVRGDQSGFFFGVQIPIEVNVPNPGADIDLFYDTNYRFEANEPYVSETVYWGTYQPTGDFSPIIPERIDECRNSSFPPDLGEVAAMQAMVQKMSPIEISEMTINYNSWEGKLSRTGYGSTATRADLEQDKKVLSLAKEQFGDFYTCLTIPWGGLGRDMPSLGPEAREPLSSALQQELLSWARKQDIRLHTWAPLKAICPWLGVNRYCPEHKAWWGKHHDVPYNCPADRDFMHWWTQLQVALITRDQFGGYALDEYLPNPRTGLPCASTNHDHLPGDASYGYFVARRKIFRTLRSKFGPDFHLEAARPNQDAGVWDMLYADYVFTLSEDEKLGGDEIRYRSRVRHFYHFLPSYMDEIYFRPDDSDNLDYLILSGLAVSNRHCVYGLGKSKQERDRIRHWYDWARDHLDLMTRQTIFLPHWPGDGECDTYFRIDSSGHGFAFVFNANDKPTRTILPLNNKSGLHPDKPYRIQQVFPKGPDTFTASDQVQLLVPGRQALLIAFEPEAK